MSVVGGKMGSLVSTHISVQKNGDEGCSFEFVAKQHTPTPWECYPISNRTPYYGLRKVGHDRQYAEIVDTFMDTAVLEKYDAQHIVKCVNTHDDLIKALVAAKISHYECEGDPFFSCHASESSKHYYHDDGISLGPTRTVSQECTCGADAHNSSIDAALKKAGEK